MVALAGGTLGFLGAVIQEALAFSFLGVFFAGPMIEEATKPVGLYLLLAYRPQVLRRRFHTARLAALAGLTFGLVESTVYVFVYVPEPSTGYIAFRYTVPVAMHMLTSFIFGFGINERLKASIRGDVPFLSRNWLFFVAAMALHSTYNIGAVAYELVSAF